MSERKPDIYTARPPNEETAHSIDKILEELETAGFDTKTTIINEGLTQPDGSTVFYVYLNGYHPL